MEKKIALVVGCILLYTILHFLTNGVIHMVLIVGLLGYFAYKNNK